MILLYIKMNFKLNFGNLLLINIYIFFLLNNYIINLLIIIFLIFIKYINNIND